VRPVVFLVLSLGAFTGCYHYVAADRASLAPGTPVAIDLTNRGMVNVSPRIGDNVMTVEGNVTEAAGSGITLTLLAVQRRGENLASTWEGESIHLAPEDIDDVRRRELSRSRTTIASVALGAAAVGLVIALAKATGLLQSSGMVKGPPPPP
jgi:hypothetical protein